MFDRDGADAMRWFLMASPILRGGNLVVTEQGIREGVRQVMIPLWNAWYFFALYANAAAGGEGYAAQASTASAEVLDRYLLAKLREFVEAIQAQLDTFEIADACDTMRGFLDVLTNWYIRRSRDRFWDTDNALCPSTTAAFDTLYTALELVTRAVAPLLPLTTEEIWRGLTGGRSVHLTDWPDAAALPADPDLVAAMDAAREVCSAALALRKAGGLRARLPLAELTVVTAYPQQLEPFVGIVADEVNVRGVMLRDLAAAHESDFGVTQRLTVNARAAGPRLGKDVQAAIKAAKTGDWSTADGVVTSGGIPLQEGEYVIDTVVSGGAEGGRRAVAVLPRGGYVLLDTEVTPELAAEGVANDLIRVVQQARRETGLHVSDRITLTLRATDGVRAALTAHLDRVCTETLTERLVVDRDATGAVTAVVGGEPVGITVEKCR